MTTERPELEEKLSELEILRQSVEEAKQKEKENYNQMLKSVAEFQNFRRQNDIRLREARLSGQKDILESIMTLCDALDQADQTSQNATEVRPLKEGLSLVKKQFDKFLKDQKVESIESVGKALDPQLHEVIAQEPNDELEEGTITSEIQRGYKLNEFVLRPARVRVSVKTKISKQEEK